MTRPGAIVDFYSGAKPDDRGRFLREIHAWPDSRLESVHDYIQWLFPVPEPSSFNPGAPILDRETAEAFRESVDLKQELRNSFLRMLAFYGMEWHGQQVLRGSGFAARSKNWLTKGNHNHLRITRILKCLSLLGLSREAGAFFEALSAIAGENPDIVSARTGEFWKEAAATTW